MFASGMKYLACCRNMTKLHDALLQNFVRSPKSASELSKWQNRQTYPLYPAEEASVLRYIFPIDYNKMLATAPKT
jgi:hypothetical protein